LPMGVRAVETMTASVMGVLDGVPDVPASVL